MRKILLAVLAASFTFAAGSAEWSRAQELYHRTQYQQSLAVLRESGTKDAATLQLMGQDYFMLGEYKKATEVLEKALALNQDSAELYHWLGRAYGRRAETASPFTAPGLASKTRQMFERAVQLNPGDKAAAGDLLDYYLDAPGFLGGGTHKAEQLAQLIGQHDQAEGHYAQALVDDKKKEYDAAEQQLRRALELAPRQVGRVVELAKYLGKRGSMKESDQLFDQALKMAPNNPRIKFERASAYIQERRNLDEAKKLLEDYMRSPLTPDDPPRQRAAEMIKKTGL